LGRARDKAPGINQTDFARWGAASWRATSVPLAQVLLAPTPGEAAHLLARRPLAAPKSIGRSRRRRRPPRALIGAVSSAQQMRTGGRRKGFCCGRVISGQFEGDNNSSSGAAIVIFGRPACCLLANERCQRRTWPQPAAPLQQVWNSFQYFCHKSRKRRQRAGVVLVCVCQRPNC